MKKTIATWLLVCGLCATALAQEKPADKPAPDAAKKEPPKAEQSVTQHTALIGGAPVTFTATAGTLIVKNAKDEPWASIGYVAYVRKDAGPVARRPIAFCYNGGPGSSSIWLHMGALGPRRVVVADAAPTPPPPYQVVDNAYSLLDKVDIVLIDPVGTGVSQARRRLQEPGLLGRRSRHRVDLAVHQTIRLGQRPLELAEVPDRRELRHDPLARHRRLAAEQGRHDLQRRRAHLARHRPRRDLRSAGQ